MRPKLAIQDGGQREEEEGGKWPYLRHVYYLPGGEIGAEGLKNQLKKNTGMKKVKKEKEGRRGRRRRGKEGEGEEGEGRKEREKKKGKKKKEKMNKERKKRRSRAPVSLTVEDHQGPLEIS